MSTFACPVVRFSLDKHPDADTLSVASIDGTDWKCVVKTEEWPNEKLGVYVPVDAIVSKDAPAIENHPLAFMNGRKVRTCRLRGYVSQGILLPLSTVVDYTRKAKISTDFGQVFVEGFNAAPILHIVKWEPAETLLGGSATSSGSNGDYLEGPDEFTFYTDIERIQNYKNVFSDGDMVVITEKLHGTSARYGLIDGEFYIGTRKKVLRTRPYISNRSRRAWQNRPFWTKVKHFFSGKKLVPRAPVDTIWHQVARKYDIENILRNFDDSRSNIIVYGEIIGQSPNGSKVQDLTYGLKDLGFYVYDIKTGEIDEKMSYEPYIVRKIISNHLGLNMVPLLKFGELNKEVDYTLRNGKDTISNSHMREGVVIEPATPRYDDKLGRVKLKLLSEEYEMRKKPKDNIDAK